MGAVGVDPGLEPHPGVPQFGVRVAPGDLPDHRLGAGQGDLVLRDTLRDGRDDGGAAEVADPGALPDQCDLLGRLDHPLPHDGLGDVHQFQARDSAGDLGPQQSGDVVVLDPEPAAC